MVNAGPRQYPALQGFDSTEGNLMADPSQFPEQNKGKIGWSWVFFFLVFYLNSVVNQMCRQWKFCH